MLFDARQSFAPAPVRSGYPPGPACRPAAWPDRWHCRRGEKTSVNNCRILPTARRPLRHHAGRHHREPAQRSAEPLRRLRRVAQCCEPFSGAWPNQASVSWYAGWYAQGANTGLSDSEKIRAGRGDSTPVIIALHSYANYSAPSAKKTKDKDIRSGKPVDAGTPQTIRGSVATTLRAQRQPATPALYPSAIRTPAVHR